MMVGGGPDNYGSTQIYNLVTGTWRDGAPPQKDRALHGCSPLELEDGEMAVVVAGNDFSPMDLAEVHSDFLSIKFLSSSIKVFLLDIFPTK